MENQFEYLLSPFKIGNVTIRNRFCMGPMGGNHFTSKGELSDAAIDYYVERARGGFGLIISGSYTTDMDVDAFSKIDAASPLYMPNNFKRTALRLNERLASYDTKMLLQITLGYGRNHPGGHTPSDTPVFQMPSYTAKALTVDQIKKKIESLVKAAELAKRSGFVGVEIHALHWGYLLDQFAMSITNRRTDEYGGCLENRLRITKESLEGIKQVCGSDFPVGIRLGLKSYIKDLENSSYTGEDEAGRTLEEGLRICQLLESYGYDALDVDVGIYDSFYHAAPPAYMPKGHVIPLAAEAKKLVKIPILCGSRMGDPYMCETALREGKIDAVVLARSAKADPAFPQKVEMGVPEKIRPCIACNLGCFGRSFMRGMDTGCAVNPACNKEMIFSLSRATKQKKIAVIGGGIAGMEAARTSKLRGHDVVLYEKANVLGGNLHTAGAHSFKDDIRSLFNWYVGEINELGIPVYCGVEVDPDMIKKIGVDTVILAVGSQPVMPPIPGIDHEKTCSCTDALLGNKPIGNQVIVVGGGLVGCEIAIDYAMNGKQVSIVEMLPSLLAAGLPVPIMVSGMVIDMIEHYAIDVYTGYKLDSINDEGTKIVSVDGGDVKVLPTESVVISTGFKPLPSMARDLYGSGIEVFQIGDGLRVGNICTSVGDAYEVARLI